MLRIGIADDHMLVRKGIIQFIDYIDGMEVVLEAEHGKDLLAKLPHVPIDVLLLDLQMPILDGFQTCLILHENYPEIKILVISQLIGRDTVNKAIACGAHGYLTKDFDPALLQIAIQSVYESGFYFDPTIGNLLRNVIFSNKKDLLQADPLHMLSERELEVIVLAGKGLNNVEIADQLFVAIRTIESHRARIMEKTFTKNFMTVIILAIKHGYLPLADL